MTSWPHNEVPDQRYADMFGIVERADEAIDHDAIVAALMESVSAEHYQRSGAGPLFEFNDGPAMYLFARAGTSHADRTVAAVGHLEPPTAARDLTYQRGYPLPDRYGGRTVDRGHLIPYSGGGQYGPNLIVQDRALNRGLSRDGRGYRAMERAAVAGAPHSVMFARPRYGDDSDVPMSIDLGVVTQTALTVRTFRNRFDIDHTVANPHRELNLVLPGATNNQIGALGEETASITLTDHLDATIVAMGDAEMSRHGANQDLDLLAIVDGELIAYEVKTRYLSTSAGRLTRAGTLLRPRLQRSPTPRAGQASQTYVTSRLHDQIDVGTGYAGITIEVIAVDFVSMLAQRFSVNDTGTRLRPCGPPIDCASAADEALLSTIVDHRGYL